SGSSRTPPPCAAGSRPEDPGATRPSWRTSTRSPRGCDLTPRPRPRTRSSITAARRPRRSKIRSPASSPPHRRLMLVDDHAADVLAVVHVLVRLVHLVERVL